VVEMGLDGAGHAFELFEKGHVGENGISAAHRRERDR
jgi:hypothetical protein